MTEQESVRRVSHRTIYRGRVVTLDVDRVVEPGGREVEREVVRHAGAAAMLALTEENQLVLVRQYRYAVDEPLWEIPAGTLAPGERPEEAARRELVEETGYYPQHLEKLAEFYPTPGFSDELIHLYVATDLEQRSARPDEDEAIEVGIFSLDEVAAMISAGRIRDGKSLVGVMLFQSRRR